VDQPGEQPGGRDGDNGQRDNPDRPGDRRRRPDRGGRRGGQPSNPGSSSSSSRSRSRRRRRKHWIKPKEYNGETSFESFMATFNTAAEFNGWDQREKLAYLRTSLTGTAVQLLWEANDITYTQLVAKLKERYGSVGMEERYQTELRCLRRKDGESIRELAHAIRCLMARAYPGESDSRLGQHIARDSFLTALNDPELQFEVRMCDPHTLEETVKLASRIEISRSAVEQPAPTCHRVNRRVEEQPPVSQQPTREPDYEQRVTPRAEPSHRQDNVVKYSQETGTQASQQPRSPRKRAPQSCNVVVRVTAHGGDGERNASHEDLHDGYE